MISTQIAISIALIIFMSRHMTVKVCPSIRYLVIIHHVSTACNPFFPVPIPENIRQLKCGTHFLFAR